MPIKVVGKLKYISIHSNVLTVSFPKENTGEKVIEILYGAVGLIKENKIDKVLLILNQATPSISDVNLIALLGDIFYTIPFSIKVAFLHPDTIANLQTRFIEQMCFSKAIVARFFNCDYSAKFWLENECICNLPLLSKKMSL